MKKFIMDGFKNILKGLGGDKDPRQNRIYQKGMDITQQIADDLYSFNWMAAKCVDIPVDDATKKWRNLLIPDVKKKEDIEKIYKEFDVKGKVSQAMKWARTFGGSVIIMVVEGDQEEPLDLDNIAVGSLKNFLVLDRYQVTTDAEERDILSPNFGQPKYYMVNRGGQRIHHSRVVKFDGAKPTIYQAERNDFWGLSIFAKLWEPIGDSQETTNSIAALIYESNIDVYRIAGFNALVATNEKLALKRIEIAHRMKSVINGIVLDKEDEYDKKTNTFTTLPEIDDRMVQKVTGAADIPITRFMGVAPAGENATGESDLRNYYDGVQSHQENDLRPKLDVIDKVVLGNAGYNDTFSYEFLPLQQMSEAEQADVDLKKAQRDQVYLDQDIIEPLDVLKQLEQEGTYSSIDGNRIKKEELEEELDFGESNTDPDSAFNGAQVAAILDIVTKVSIGELDRTTAARMINTSFPVTEQEALRMLENIPEPEEGSELGEE